LRNLENDLSIIDKWFSTEFGRFWIFSDINMEVIIKRNGEYGCQPPTHWYYQERSFMFVALMTVRHIFFSIFHNVTTKMSMFSHWSNLTLVWWSRRNKLIIMIATDKPMFSFFFLFEIQCNDQLLHILIDDLFVCIIWYF
jgi:hypothetical protein